MKRKIEMTIDFTVQEYSHIKLKQFDDTQIIFKVVYEGISFSLEGLQVSLVFEKPDNTIVYQECTIEENEIKADLLKNCLRQNGNANIELQISNNSEMVSTFQIPVLIAKSAKENVKSENTPNYIETLENAISEEKTRQQNEELRKSNELERQQNEEERTKSEENREASEESRIEAETQRNSNEKARQTNETTREENEDDRIAAEELREQAENDRAEGYSEIKNYFDNNAIATHKYNMVINEVYEKETNITIPCYYKVGADVLDVIYCGSKLVLGQDYNEIGNTGEVSNIIQFLDSVGDLDMSDVEGFEDFTETLEFVVRGEYNAS